MSARRNGPQRIREALARASDGLLVGELVASTNLHENAVRRALATFVARGDVIIEREAPRARGRPPHRYRLAGGADEPFRHLVPMLLDLLDSTGAPAEAAFAVGRAHAERTPGYGRGSAREAVIESLVMLGFAPVERASPGATGVTLDLTRCPFADAVTASANGRQVCHLHHGLLAGVAAAGAGELDEFVINDPRVAPCRVAFHAVAPRDPRPS